MSKEQNTHRFTVSWFKDDIKKLESIEKFLAEQDLPVTRAVLMRCILHVAKIDPLLVQVTRIKWHEELKRRKRAAKLGAKAKWHGHIKAGSQEDSGGAEAS